MVDNCRVTIPWSDLPKDLLEKIAKCLDSEIDFLRVRAVCSSWRSSTTPFKKFPCETVKLPFPFDARETLHPKHHGAYMSLVQRSVYRVELPNGSKEPNFWLVKIERLSDGKMRILNPVSNHQIKILPGIPMPKTLNALDFRISEVCKAYALKYVNPSKPNLDYEFNYAKKVVVSTDVENDDYVIMAIDKSDKLWYTKSGDEKWTMVRDYNACFKFDDAVKYKGEFHGIDGWGGTWAFDSVFESTRVSYNMYGTALKRHLVELCNGDLFLVEEVRDKYARRPNPNNIIHERPRGLHTTTAKKLNMDVIIYGLHKNEKEWVETRTVNDWIIVVGDDCSYSVSTKGCSKGTRVFYPCESYRIISSNADYADYFRDAGLDNFIASDEVELRFRGFHGDSVGVCDYESGKTGSMLMFPEYADIFWPPPSWLSRT